jgi:hypothetical protein
VADQQDVADVARVVVFKWPRSTTDGTGILSAVVAWLRAADHR